MRRVFLSCHFGDSDRELVRRTEGLLESHNLQVITGEELGGGALTAEVMERIRDSDALVALMTKRDEEPKYAGTHPWVVDEFKCAKNLNKPSIALVAPEVTVVGAYQENERIDYNPADIVKAFLKLSKTIGYWKSQAGRLLKVQVLPREVAEKIAAANGGAKCSYRLCGYDGTFRDWRPVDAIPEGDGTYLYLKGVTDEARIQLRAEILGAIWVSKVLPQWMPVELIH
jgi:hypothetical protein